MDEPLHFLCDVTQNLLTNKNMCIKLKLQSQRKEVTAMDSNITIEQISDLFDTKINQLKNDLELSLDEKLETKLEEKLETILEEKLETILEEKLETKLDKKLDEKLDSKLDEKFDAKFDKKLNPIYSHLNNIDNRLDNIDNRLDNVDKRLDNLDDRLKNVELTQENKILPAINELTSVYLSTYKTFEKKSEQIDTLVEDVKVIKLVLEDHSKKLQKIS